MREDQSIGKNLEGLVPVHLRGSSSIELRAESMGFMTGRSVVFRKLRLSMNYIAS